MLLCGMFSRRFVGASVSTLWRIQQPCYSTKTGSQDTSTAERLEPVSMSFNSYETTLAETKAAPIIIMHGKAIDRNAEILTHFYGNIYYPTFCRTLWFKIELEEYQ